MNTVYKNNMVHGWYFNNSYPILHNYVVPLVIATPSDIFLGALAWIQSHRIMLQAIMWVSQGPVSLGAARGGLGMLSHHSTWSQTYPLTFLQPHW